MTPGQDAGSVPEHTGSKQRVLLVGPDQEENLSIRYLGAALVAAGHDVVIAPFDHAADASSVVEAAKSTTLCGLSMCFQVRAPEFLQLARMLKAQAPARPIVAGGHYASCAAADLLDHHRELDLVVIHEGEATLLELADGLCDRPLAAERLAGIQGLAFRAGGKVCFSEPRPRLENLDELPTPLRNGPARLLAGVPTAYLLGSRGCLGQCRYCCITTLHRLAPGRHFRQRRPQRVAEEMAQLYHDNGIRQFIFHDDNFLLPSERRNRERLDALQAALERLGVVDSLAFTLKCRPQDVQEPIFRRLRAMGLVRVFLGIESACDEGLGCLGRQHSRADAEAALELCRRLGISTQYTMMIFHPEATLETCRTDIGFMRQHVDNPLNFCRTEIYAGTPLEQRMIASGRARGDYLARSYTIADAGVQRACDISTRLFLERCWATGSLFEHAVGLDHLAALLRHFYEGRQVEDLARRILLWRLEVNRDTLALLEEVFDLAAARAELGSLEQREAQSRERLFDQGQELFEEINAFALDSVGLQRSERSVVARRVRPSRRLARHAAAALLAVSAASFTACNDKGVSEYAPPPTDARIEAHFRLEIGVAEKAPPPVDGKVRLEIGVAEKAPPPVDARTEKK